MQRAEVELRENILPFWIKHTGDETRGGFYGEITNDLVVHSEAPRGSLLTSRILWTYSAAYRRYQNTAYRAMADRAYEDLLTRFWDQEYGGLYWMVAADGTPIREQKQLYGQAFGIYGLSEYFGATGMQDALDKAREIYAAMEQHSYDPEHGGYFEARNRTWQPAEEMRLSPVDLNVAKSMNTHLHIMEAYANLLRVWPDPGLRSRLIELLQLMMNRIIDPDTYQMTLFFDAAWNPRSVNVSYGHDIEASWLLVESTGIAGDPELDAEARDIAVRMAQTVYDEGLDSDGALIYEAGPDGDVDTTKQWWPQAEAAVGFLNAYQLSGEQHYLEAAAASWDFIEEHLIDHEYGEWLRYVKRDRSPGADEAKVSFWKCPYHNGRACMELTERAHQLLKDLHQDQA